MEISAYCRVSQDKTGAGLSVEIQEASIRKWASEKGHTIGKLYVDNDISAAGKKVRPGFEQMLKDAPKAIVCWHQDRILRVSKDLERVLETGMVIHQVEAGSLDLATPQGRAIARTITSWTTYEIEQKAARQKLKNADAAQKGEHYWRAGIKPFGWNIDGTLEPKESAALLKVIEMIVDDNKKVSEALAYLQENGPYVRRGSVKNGFTVSKWHHSTLSRMLTDKRLIAIRTYHGEEFPGAWTPLVSEDRWDELQLALKHKEKPRKTHGRENLLTSIAICGLCGGTMGQSRSNQNIASYRCSTGKHNSKNADKADATIITYVKEMLSAPDADDILTPGDGVSMSQLKKNHRAELERWEQWQEVAAEEELSPREYAKPRAKHEARLAEIEGEMVRIGHGSIFSGIFEKHVGDPLKGIKQEQIWETLDLDQKRAFVKALFKEIKFMPGTRAKAFDPLLIKFELSDIGAKLWKSSAENQQVIGDEVRRIQDEWLNRPKDATPYRSPRV